MIRPLVVPGEADTAREAVVAIAVLPLECGDAPATVCSGTIIAPRVVLTAAHCTRYLPLDRAEIVLGRQVDGEGSRHIRIAQTLAHPHWASPAHDVALLLLAEDSGVAPLPLVAGTHSMPQHGHPVTLVGYGRDGAGETGTRHFGTARVFETTADSFRVRAESGLACTGDSGGPALALVDGVEHVVGVASYGDPDCIETATYARLDIELADFIEPAIARLASSSATPPLASTCVGAPPRGANESSEGCAVASSELGFSSNVAMILVAALVGRRRCRTNRSSRS